jgi:hypothetical protein
MQHSARSHNVKVFKVMAGLALGSTLCLAGCGSSTPKDALRVFKDPAATSNDKLAALDAANRQAQANPMEKAPLREALFAMLWDASQPTNLRRQVCKQLLADTDPATLEETATQFATLVAREPDPEIVAATARWASARGRQEFVGPLVRGAVFSPRAEPEVLAAIASLTSTPDVATALFAQVLEPSIPESQRASPMDYERRVQADAWTLLARGDADSSRRAALVQQASAPNPKAKGAALLDALRTTGAALRVMPDTGEELQWLAAIHASGDATWISQVQAALGHVPARERLAMRHLEPLRWAQLHQPTWLTMSREELFSTIRQRLAGRDVRTRPWKSPIKPYREQFDVVAQALSWADALSLLVIDECVRTASNRAMLAQQARIDRDDRTTEYGGLLMDLGAGYQFVVYPPRAAQRRSDVEFVAGEELIADARVRPGVLAHYHFHAQEDQNDDNAGPSEGDLDYAQRFASSCLVLTTVRGGKVNVDFYQPRAGGVAVVVDLGTLVLGE